MLLILIAYFLAAHVAVSDSKELRVLVLGDSLTAGCTSHCKGPMHPYHIQLKENLRQHGIESHVHDAGRPNAKTRQILVTLVHSLIGAHAHNVTIIMAGINDLAAGTRPDEVMKVLATLFSRACSQSQVLILHLLPIKISPQFIGTHPLYQDEYRIELNSLISKWTKADEALHCKSPPLALDLSSHYSPSNQSLFSDDVHLSIMGYDLLGDLIEQEILKLLTAAGLPPPLIE